MALNGVLGKLDVLYILLLAQLVCSHSLRLSIANRLLVVVRSVHSMSDEAAILAAHGDVPVAIANRLLVGLRA